MFCSSCGKSIDIKSAYCMHCGAPILNRPDPAAQVSQPNSNIQQLIPQTPKPKSGTPEYEETTRLDSAQQGIPYTATTPTFTPHAEPVNVVAHNLVERRWIESAVDKRATRGWVNKLIWFIAGLMAVLLVIRIILLWTIGYYNAGLPQLIYGLTNWIVVPFERLYMAAPFMGFSDLTAIIVVEILVPIMAVLLVGFLITKLANRILGINHTTSSTSNRTAYRTQYAQPYAQPLTRGTVVVREDGGFSAGAIIVAVLAIFLLAGAIIWLYNNSNNSTNTTNIAVTNPSQPQQSGQGCPDDITRILVEGKWDLDPSTLYYEPNHLVERSDKHFEFFPNGMVNGSSNLMSMAVPYSCPDGNHLFYGMQIYSLSLTDSTLILTTNNGDVAKYNHIK